jgi:hypothetical protein
MQSCRVTRWPLAPQNTLGYATPQMGEEPGLLERIKALIRARKYRIRLHAVRHMIEEGFDEEGLLEALEGESRILETYPSEMRCLIVGRFAVSERVRQPIHVVCDYSTPGWWISSPRICHRSHGG